MAHDCGDGRTLIVNHKDTGYSGYCFRCSDDGFQPHPQPSLAERISRLRAVEGAEQAAEADSRPPMPAEFNPSVWPLRARVWLYQAGLSNDRIHELGFYYNERLDRVVMPVLDGPNVRYWQARGFDKDRPKYLNPPIDKPLFKVGSGPVLVLTEDMLSAVRVGEVTEAWSVLGTAADDTKIAAIIATGKPVRVWLDPDSAGLKGRRKLVSKLRAYGVDATAIKTAKDPKFYSSQEIRQLVLI